ncbi:DNA-binding protein [Polyplosphaeria fusca]|uniref:DNA-binding protein n=1 Tax=Polyplosphaeria fusca TaxID=682080 RepID=A0A9P4V4J3_9PLEO|nr:DNA-binding protein [Polyplosphaeria fusca]
MARKTAVQTRTVASAQKAPSKQKTAVTVSAATGSATLPTSTEQSVTVQQSTEVMQTLLHSALSAVTYARGIFPIECFDFQVYKNISDEYTYRDFAKDSGKAKQGTGKSVYVLKQGRSSRADKFINWLQTGVFDALQRSYLRGLQISMFEDRNHPTQIVELYSFTFNYAVSADGSRTVAAMDISRPGGESLTIRHTNAGVQALVREIALLSGTLPLLPDHCFLEMRLLYTDDCPEDYQPPGFVHSQTDGSLHFPSASGWKTTSSMVGAISTGYHSVAVNMSYMLPAVDDDTIMGGIEDGRYQIPDGLEYNDSRTALHGLDWENNVPLMKVREPILTIQPKASETTTGDAESVTTQDSSDVDLNKLRGQPITGLAVDSQEEPMQTPYPRIHVGEHNISNSAKQPSTRPEDKEFRDRLAQMLQPSAEQSETQKTQGPAKSQQDSQSFDKSAMHAPAVGFSQTVIDQLEKNRSRLLPPLKSASNNRTSSADFNPSNERDEVRCECGNGEGVDAMIHCRFCNTWQHTHCYGYLGHEDVRIPEVHACYHCLLHTSDNALYREMRGLALRRRAIHVLNTIGFSTDKKLSKDLRCDLKTVKTLKEEFSAKGLLVSNAGNKSTLAGKPQFSVTRDEKMFRKIQAEYYNPTARISHLTELPAAANDSIPRPNSKQNASQRKGSSTPSNRFPLRKKNTKDMGDKSHNEPAAAGPSRRGKKRAQGLDSHMDISTPKRPRLGLTRSPMDIAANAVTPSVHD